jgi:hypothetical protein
MLARPLASKQLGCENIIEAWRTPNKNNFKGILIRYSCPSYWKGAWGLEEWGNIIAP